MIDDNDGHYWLGHDYTADAIKAKVEHDAAELVKHSPVPIYVSRDVEFDDERLRGAVAMVRGGIVETAERDTPLPERFTTTPHRGEPAMLITDQDTGRTAMVPLEFYHEARKMLTALFA